MNTRLYLPPTRYTPELILDEEKRTFSVTGNCIDGTQEFFSQALANLERILNNLREDEVFTISRIKAYFTDGSISPLTEEIMVQL